MAQDFDQMLKDVLGDSWDKLTKFQTDQLQKVTDKIEGVAREALKPELDRISSELAELRARIIVLEQQRKSVKGAPPSIEPSI